MIIRFVQVRTIESSAALLKLAYERGVIPPLRSTEGCLSASLLQKESDPQECISMTTWRSEEDAQRYEGSGRFKELLDLLRPYFADATEWKLDLGSDFTIRYEPVSNEPVIRRLNVSAEGKQQSAAPVSPDYIRIVSHQIKEGARSEFRRIYEHDILPVLRRQEGCQRAYLVEDPSDPTKMLSVTAWMSHRDAAHYEQNGAFSALLSKLEPTLTDLVQWKMQLGSTSRSRVSTSDDVAVDGYTLLVGEDFSA